MPACSLGGLQTSPSSSEREGRVSPCLVPRQPLTSTSRRLGPAEGRKPPPSSTLTPGTASPGRWQQGGARRGAWAKVGLGHQGHHECPGGATWRAARLAWALSQVGTLRLATGPRPGLGPGPHAQQHSAAPSSAQQRPVAPSSTQQHPAPLLMLGDLLPPGPVGSAPLGFLGAGQNI